MGGLVVMKHGHDMSQSWFLCSWGFGIYGEVDQWIFSLSVGSHEFDIHDSFVSYHKIRCISNWHYFLIWTDLKITWPSCWGSFGDGLGYFAENSWKFGVRDHCRKPRINRVTGWALEKETEGGWCNKPPSNIISIHITSHHPFHFFEKSQKNYKSFEPLRVGVWVYLPTRSCWQKWPANCQTFHWQFLYRSMLLA